MVHSTDRTQHAAEITFAAQALAEHYRRFTEPVVDVDDWLDIHKHRRSSALLVVWDRTDAAILTRERPELVVCVAANRIDWARRRAANAARRDDIPGQQPRSPTDPATPPLCGYLTINSEVS